jgi:hypothetical protein
MLIILIRQKAPLVLWVDSKLRLELSSVSSEWLGLGLEKIAA